MTTVMVLLMACGGKGRSDSSPVFFPGQRRVQRRKKFESVIGSGLWYDETFILPMPSMGDEDLEEGHQMAKDAHARRIEHRANLRKAAAGQLSEAEAKEVQAAETARKAAIKPAAVLNRKQRKSQRTQRRLGK